MIKKFGGIPKTLKVGQSELKRIILATEKVLKEFETNLIRTEDDAGIVRGRIPSGEEIPSQREFGN